MADAPRTDHDDVHLPEGLLAELATPPRDGIRPEEVARGRRHAAERAYDEGEVVEEIASQLLLLSRP